MKIKAVSPLIATIILIALTVALGAVIVGWAKGYVRGQISNLGAQSEILVAQEGGGAINITAENIGSNAILANDIEVEVQTATGNIYKCPVVQNSAAGSALTCYVSNIVNPSNTSISYLGSSISSNTIFVIYVNSSLSGDLAGGQVSLLYYGNEMSSSYTLQ
ncbi:hypothetical protein MJ1_0420 [Nanobdella aerobiophila]|uniref:Uncharacterized protein n=1 Tax=Nanobdella aerobiophila TaxID=2586965 RepID=A0A915WSU9_9ARCH|nr:archaellin/type IV pilin N-terminal domain-containing protein [Nanobdella aerobiophila]BBL45582.1 hypothetical protein MJ1_0420 [Nanobdella aerobiophila]